MKTLRARVPLALFVLTGMAAAQAGFDPLSSRRLGESFFPLLNGPFKRTCALELNGDFRADALVLVDDQVVVSLSPGIYHALVTLPRTAVDMCPLDSRAPLGRDAFLVSSSRPRLELWWLDESSLELEVQPLGGDVWAGVVELSTADLTGDQMPDILGVTADRQAVITLAHPFVQDEGFLAIGETIHRLLPIEWDGTPGKELALLTSFGLRVCELDGSPLHQVATDGDDSDRFCSVGQATHLVERLSTLLQAPNAVYYLYTAGAAKVDLLTWLGLVDPVAITSGDYAGDGLQDVCISHKTTGQLAYFANQSAVAPDAFTWADYALWDPTSDGSGALPAPQNQAHALLEDLDQDGDGDVFFPVEKEDDIAMLRNVTLDHLARAPTVQSAAYAYEPASLEGKLALTLAAPVLPPSEDDRLLVVVWRQPTLKNDVRTEPAAIHQQLVHLTGWPLTVTIPLTEPLFTDTLFHVELRQAECTGSEVLTASATAVWTFTTSESSKNDMIFFHGVPPGSILETPIDDGSGGSQLSAGGWTGPMPCIPCFGDNVIPDPGLDHLAKWRTQQASAPKNNASTPQ